MGCNCGKRKRKKDININIIVDNKVKDTTIVENTTTIIKDKKNE